MTHLT